MKNKIFLIVTMLFVTFSLFGQGNRINIKDQLEKSDFEGSIVVTDSDNEQTYLQPGAETGILTIVGGVPTWVVGATGEMTTVTDQANGLNINLIGFDITIEHNIPELSTAASVDATNDLLYLYDDSAGSITKTNPSSLFGTIVLPDLSDVPAYPTGTTDDYVLVRDDATDSNSWQDAAAFSSNIYTDDGTLAADRVVNLDGNDLTIVSSSDEFNFIDATNQLRIGDDSQFATHRVDFTSSGSKFATSHNGSKIAGIYNGNYFISNSGGGASYVMDVYGSATGSLQSFAAEGDASAPTAVSDGRIIMNLRVSGYDGSAWSTSNTNSVLWQADASEDYTPTAQGKQQLFFTIENGTVAGDTALYLHNNGDVTLGDNQDFFYDKDAQSLQLTGDGFPEPILGLHIDDGSFDFTFDFGAQNTNIESYSGTNSNVEHRINFIKHRGTFESPSAAAVNDQIAQIRFQAESLSGTNVGSAINAYVRDQSSDGYYMADINFRSRAKTGGEYTSVSINENGYLELLNYGSGNVEAEDISLTESDYTPHFATANGTIVERLRTKHSNVLYVHPDGDSTTAVIGDPFRPYSNPFEAAQVADSGDLVIVYPGYWSVGDSSAAMIQKVATEYSTYSLYKNGVSFYFHPGAEIEVIGKTVGQFYLWAAQDSTNGQWSKTLGYGSFKLWGQRGFLSLDWEQNITWDFEADYYEHGSDWSHIIRGGTHNVNIAVKRVLARIDSIGASSGERAAFVFTNAASGNVIEVTGKINVDIGEYEYQAAKPTGDFGNILTVRNTDSLEVNMSVDIVHGIARGSGLILQLGGSNANVKNTQVNVDVGLVNIRDTFITKFYPTFDSEPVNNATTDSVDYSTLVCSFMTDNSENINVTFDVGSIRGNVGYTVLYRNTVEQSFFSGSVGDIVMQDSFPAIALAVRSEADSTSRMDVHLKGQAQTNGIPVLFPSNTWMLAGTISLNGGTVRTTSPNVPIVQLPNDLDVYGADLIFNNVTFLGHSGASIFKSDGVDLNDVYIKNCYSNNTTVNGNVTELIDTIVRSSVVR